MKNGLIINEYCTKEYYLNNKLHRENGPAIEFADGETHWYLHDELHREDGPAIEFTDGTTYWYLNGKKHRVDGPAEEYTDGRQHWYINGKKLIHPEEFETMETFIQYLNDNEEYSLQWISDFNGIIEIIKEPSGKQTRLHAMRWKI